MAWDWRALPASHRENAEASEGKMPCLLSITLSRLQADLFAYSARRFSPMKGEEQGGDRIVTVGVALTGRWIICLPLQLSWLCRPQEVILPGGLSKGEGPVWMLQGQSWSIKKAGHCRIDAFQMCCWRRLLRVLWTAKRWNQSVLKEINPECSLEGLKLKLKLWPPDVKSWFIGKDPDAGKHWGKRRRGLQKMKWLDHQFNEHGFDQTLGDGGGQRNLTCNSPWGHKE